MRTTAEKSRCNAGTTASGGRLVQTAAGRRGRYRRAHDHDAGAPLGSSDVDVSALLPGIAAPGTRAITPVYAYLLELADGVVLVDTGMSPVYIDDPAAGFDPGFAALLTPRMTGADRLEARLAEAGLRVGDITAVINTHLHFDHAGNNALFEGVPIYVQRAHYEQALGHPAYPNEN